MTFTVLKYFFSQKHWQQTVEAQNMCIRYIKNKKQKHPKTPTNKKTPPKHQEKKKKKTNVTGIVKDMSRATQNVNFSFKQESGSCAQNHLQESYLKENKLIQNR